MRGVGEHAPGLDLAEASEHLRSANAAGMRPRALHLSFGSGICVDDEDEAKELRKALKPVGAWGVRDVRVSCAPGGEPLSALLLEAVATAVTRKENRLTAVRALCFFSLRISASDAFCSLSLPRSLPSSLPSLHPPLFRVCVCVCDGTLSRCLSFSLYTALFVTLYLSVSRSCVGLCLSVSLPLFIPLVIVIAHLPLPHHFLHAQLRIDGPTADVNADYVTRFSDGGALERIVLRGTRVGNNGLAGLVGGAPAELRTLDVGGSRDVSSGGIKHCLAMCPGLTTLAVDGLLLVDDDAFEPQGPVKGRNPARLEVLSARGCANITDAAIAALLGLTASGQQRKALKRKAPPAKAKKGKKKETRASALRRVREATRKKRQKKVVDSSSSDEAEPRKRRKKKVVESSSSDEAESSSDSGSEEKEDAPEDEAVTAAKEQRADAAYLQEHASATEFKSYARIMDSSSSGNMRVQVGKAKALARIEKTVLKAAYAVERPPGAGLRVLLLSGTNITDASLEMLGGLSGRGLALEELDISTCAGVTNSGIMALGGGLGSGRFGCVALRRLTLRGLDKVTHDGVEVLANLPLLTHVDMSECANVREIGVRRMLLAPAREGSIQASLAKGIQDHRTSLRDIHNAMPRLQKPNLPPDFNEVEVRQRLRELNREAPQAPDNKVRSQELRRQLEEHNSFTYRVRLLHCKPWR